MTLSSLSEEWDINMNQKKNSLHTKIWTSFIIFSLSILLFLWLFQIIFLNKYYEIVKTKDLKETVAQITKNYNQNSLINILDNIALDKGICIEVIQNEIPIYLSTSFNKGCLGTESQNPALNTYKQQFIQSNKTTQKYNLINPKFNNKILGYGIKLDNHTYVFINASLEPLDATIRILKNQLIYVSIIVLILSFIIAYFISKKISKPIISINTKAKQMSKGDYQITFPNNQGIKEIDELAHTLNQAKEELAKTDELRRDLMANVSHDLKTPLTMIKAYAEMVRDLTYNNKEKREQNLNTIINETDRLNNLVNDILELSKLQSHILNLNYETFDIITLIQNILTHYEILIEQENSKIIFNHTHPVQITADKKKIEQVIYNLINNAIEHTEKENIIQIAITEKKDKIKISITNTGTFIKKEEQLHIWDKYYHTSKKHKRNTCGTGLGLSIVKNILEAHQFSYGVSSTKQTGTTFYFEIPNKSSHSKIKGETNEK